MQRDAHFSSVYAALRAKGQRHGQALRNIGGVSHLLHMALLKKVSRLIRLMVVGASRDIMPKAAF
jgi:hypothetical protein